MRLPKALRLLAVLPRSPREFADRCRAVVEVRLDAWLPGCTPVTEGWELFVARLDERFGEGAAAILEEPALAAIESEVRARRSELSPGPFGVRHDADFALARTCYLACRALQPAAVLETGVGYGVTSAFLLQALEANGGGELHSVDLPPLGEDADAWVGRLVPARLRGRWRLCRGTSRRVLPSLVSRLAPLALFVHDSLHTRWNIADELEVAGGSLARPAVVIADDIDENPAFARWLVRARPASAAVVREQAKASAFGVAVFR